MNNKKLIQLGAVLAIALLTSCGSGDEGLEPVIHDQAGAKDTSGNNVLSLQGQWPTWSGTDSGIRFSNNALTIPATSNATNLVFGVQRFNQRLTSGADYELTVSSSDGGASVLLFLLNSSGQNIRIVDQDSGQSSQWASASAGDSLRFTAPDDVVGFYVQVQGSWQATVPATLSAELRFDGSDTGDGDSGSGSESLNLSGPWLTWEGQASGLSVSGQSISIPAPAAGANLRYGVKRFDQALSGGQSYELSVNGSDNESAALLFLYDRNGSVIDFADASGNVRGVHRATTGQPLRFTAPSNQARFALQVQGRWQASSGDTVAIALNGGNGGNGGGDNGDGGDNDGGADNGNGGDNGGGGNNTEDFRPAGYNTLLFSDEFNGTSLDRSQWCTRLPYGGGTFLQVADAECTKFIGQGSADYANETENQRFRDFNRDGETLHQVSDGTLKLRVTNTGANFYQRFEAAALRSKTVFKPDFSTSYYVTARVILPDILGIWPAFYLNPSLEPDGLGQWPPEIDIFEAPINGSPGENQRTLVQHAQIQGAQTDSGTREVTRSAAGFNNFWGFWTASESLRGRWIEIGAKWTANEICYFVDGLETACENYRWVTNSGAPGNPATLIMFVAVGGPWAGKNGINDAAFPMAMPVDHIRVYQND